jgi:hypothetical protein
MAAAYQLNKTACKYNMNISTSKTSGDVWKKYSVNKIMSKWKVIKQSHP